MDGIDAALVDFSSPAPTCLATWHHPIPESVLHRLTAMSAPHWRGSLEALGRLDAELGVLFAEAARQLLESAAVSATSVIAIGSHGQTLCHRPPQVSLQIGDPNRIAQLTGITTVGDLRRRDLAAGGQGAPLAPAFHAAFFRSEVEDRVALNIGGMANITTLPSDQRAPVIGFDTGPGNILMDYWIKEQRGLAYDNEGAWSTQGQPIAPLLQAMLQDDYFSRLPPKSTGREYFNGTWLQAHLNHLAPQARPADVQATLLELSARTIAQAIQAHAGSARQVLVCGGGVHNTALLVRLSALLGDKLVKSSIAVGIEPDWVEALAFAWLAMQTLQGAAGNLPSVTGAAAPVILGGIYPGPPHPH